MVRDHMFIQGRYGIDCLITIETVVKYYWEENRFPLYSGTLADTHIDSTQLDMGVAQDPETEKN